MMKRRLVRAAVVVATIVASVGLAATDSCDYGDMDARCSFTQQDDWNYIMMVQTWPGTFCRDNCCRIPKGVSAIRDGFTIHGFWPNYATTKYPACCTSPYTKSQVESFITSDKNLKTELDTYWPALKKCKFVEYEYDKHGTCASTVYNGTMGPVDYWDAAMYLAKRWDFKSVLANAGIKPSSTQAYATEEVVSAIDAAVGKRVSLECDSSDSKLLLEVRVCIKRPDSNRLRPEPMDCPSYVSSNCNKNSIYIYPIPKMSSGGCS